MSGLYKNIYYDRNSNSMYLWEWEENKSGRGVTKKKKLEYENKYFVPSPGNVPTEWRDVSGRYMVPKVLDKKENADKKRKQLKALGMRTAELGYAAESKFLLWRYQQEDLTAQLKEKGYHNVYDVGFYDIEVASDDGFDPSCVKKTGIATHPINLITFVYNNKEDYVTISTSDYSGSGEDAEVKDFIYVESELDLLKHSFRIIGNLDVISGWNSVWFDLPYMFTRYQQLLKEELGEDYEELHILDDNNYKTVFKCPELPLGKYILNKRDGTFEIPGVQHIDYMDVYKQLTYDPHDSYSLGYVCQRNIGEGKVTFDGTIFTIWKTDYNKFVEYNIQDTLLLKKLDQKLGFLEVYTIFAYSSLIPLSRVESSIAQIEGYIIKYLHRKGVVMPDKERVSKKESEDDEGFEGAYVVANPGRYKWLVSYDATSMYPHIIMQWNISPETKVLGGNPNDMSLIRTYRPDLFYKNTTKGVVPEIVEDIFNQRKYWKDLYNQVKKTDDKVYARYCYNLQLNFKILANSIYGVLGNKHFVFYDIDNAECVTMMGQNIIKFFTEDVVPNIFSKMNYKQFNKLFPELQINENGFERIQTRFKSSRSITDTDSVVGSTLINTSEGDIPIEELFERYAATGRFFKYDEANSDYVVSVNDGLMAMSYSNTNELQQKRIVHVMKHKVKKRMFKITIRGKSVTVTEDHSIMVLRDGCLVSAKPMQLRKGDICVSLKNA